MYLVISGTNSYARNLDLGNKYLLSEDYDNAIRAFSNAIEIDEKSEEAYIGRGDAYKAKGDYVSAWEDYEKAQELSGDKDLLRDKIGVTEIKVVSEDGEGVTGATVMLDGETHSYELLTDDEGVASEVLFPEEYSVGISKENYENYETEVSAKKGGSVIRPIEIKVSEEISTKESDIWVLTKKSEYRFDEPDPTYSIELIYNNNGDIIHKSVETENGNKTWEYSYTDSEIICTSDTGDQKIIDRNLGEETEIDFESQFDGINVYQKQVPGDYEYEYENGLPTVARHYSENGTLEMETKYSYDADGNLLKEDEVVYYESGSAHHSSKTYTYNNEGFKITEKFSSDEVSADYYKEFEYDENGNCTVVLWYQDGAPGAIRTERRYERLSDALAEKNEEEISGDNIKNYQEIYADLLRELSSKATVPSRLTFQLIYLDGDDIPELVVAEGHSLGSQVSIYTIPSNRVMPIYCDGNNWGNHGWILYCEHENLILNSYTTVGSGEYIFYRIYDEEVLRVKGFSKRGEDYYIEGNSVSQEEYDAAFIECGGNRLKMAGYDTGTVVSEDSIQLLLNNDPVCYNGEGGPL